jgi:hypothetical protein
MRIGLVGVPGSGKSALAESIKKALEDIGNKNHLPVAIVDGYVEQLQTEVDLALSWSGTYIGNNHVALKRESQERVASKDNKTVISCGTLFETSSYTAQALQEDYELLEEDDMEGKHDLVLRTEAVTRILACLYADTLRYDHIFYLPPVGEITDFRVNDLEKNLQAAFNAFKLFPVTKLFVDGDNMLEITENRLKIVLKEVLSADNAEKQDVQTQESN